MRSIRCAVRALAPYKPEFKRDVVFLSAKRTPFGKFVGSLKDHTATDLGVVAGLAAIEQSKINRKDIDQVIFGNVIQSSSDAPYLARHVALRCDLPVTTPGVTVNRLCGSGFQAQAEAAMVLENGDARAILAGGAENMSQTPYVVRGARVGVGLGQGQLEDLLWFGLTDSYCGVPMGGTAENLAVMYKLGQKEVDEYAARSHALAVAAREAGRLKDEIVPIEVKQGKTVVKIENDEQVRAGVKPEDFAKLPKVFKKNGVVHAAAASGICDGAGALVMSTMDYSKANGLKPLARMVAYGVVGVPPEIMGIGPVGAVKQILEKTGLTIADIDYFEINEAFAPQCMSCRMELGIPMEKFNLDGGAIAIGHPLGATGARVSSHLIYALKARKQRFGIASACTGGGMGIAVLIENIA